MIDTREKTQQLRPGAPFLNQIKAANEIYENYFTQWVTTVIMSAECQAGKTGGLQVLIEDLYPVLPTMHIFIIVPSNTPLREQTQERIFKSPRARLRTVQRRVHHAADIYGEGPKRDAIESEIKAILSLGEQVLVVWDEAHIGAGTTRTKNKSTQEVDVEWQKIPALFDELFGGIPGCAAAAGVRYLAITATPFDWDHYIDANPGCDTAEVILDAGPGYIGLRELKNQGRLFPHIKRNKVKGRQTQEDVDFKKRLQNLMTQLSLQEIPKYLVFRCTTPKERRWFEYAAQAATLPYREFVSSTGTIGDFEETLRTPPIETQVLMIVQSFKEGQTICHDHIGAWYECDTKSGRNHADIYQSVGRNMGYFDSGSTPAYPIYMDMEVADLLTDYIDAMYKRDFSGKRVFPTTSTHKKVKCTTKPDRFCVAYNSRQEAEKDFYQRQGINTGRFIVEKVSKNKHDMIGNLINGAARRGKGRVNIHFCDAPSYNSAHKASWDNNPQWHGKYIIQYDTGRMKLAVEVKSTSMLTKTN